MVRVTGVVGCGAEIDDSAEHPVAQTTRMLVATQIPNSSEINRHRPRFGIVRLSITEESFVGGGRRYAGHRRVSFEYSALSSDFSVIHLETCSLTLRGYLSVSTIQGQ